MTADKVRLFIVGVPKSGTTSLHRYLETHPGIFLSNPKELNYFSSKEINEQQLYYTSDVIENYDSYKKYFSKALKGQVLGEASVSYMYYKGVASRIKSYNPEAVCVVLLRNPTNRAYSHYLMDKRLGYVSASFEEIFRNPEQYPLHYQQYFKLGLYYEQVKPYMELFGGNLYISTDLQLKENPLSVVNEICSLLEIDPFTTVDEKNHNSYKEPYKFSAYLYRIDILRRIIKKTVPNSISTPLKKILFSDKSKPTLSKNIEQEVNGFFKKDLEKLKCITGLEHLKL